MDDSARWFDTDPDRDPDADPDTPHDDATGERVLEDGADALGEDALDEDALDEDALDEDALDEDALDEELLDEEGDPVAEPEATWVHCPYCGEAVELLLDPGGGAFQEYVEDCEVCCRPWRVEVSFGRDGLPTVELFTDDE